MTPGALRRRFSLAIALLVHAIIIVLMIGFMIIPRSPAGSGGEGVGLEYVAGEGDVDSEPAPLPVSETPAEAAPAAPVRKPPARVEHMEITPGGRADGDLFLARVRAHLARFRRELPGAVRRQGMVMLQFSLSATGDVSAVRIIRSSGDAVLDDEALALLKRAVPLPSRGCETELRVPVEFETGGIRP